ncbi:MAG: hypothetical protein U5O39_13400 [Gammaproteobacteria bacterium]|nr:hypothetical protein [Gammaproteobacteria bacterium]
MRRDRVSIRDDRSLGQALAYLLAKMQCILVLHVRQNHDKLFTTESGDYIRGPIEVAVDLLRHHREAFVASEVAVRVVDLA